MAVRGLVLLGACLALATLAGCGPRGEQEAEQEQGATVEIAAALDPCAGGEGFAQNLCKNRALAALDTQIRESLVAQAESISPEGAQLLVRNEQEWREAQRINCGIIDPDATPNAEQEQCLQSRLRERAIEARTAVQQIGGYTFQRVEDVRAEPVTAQIAEASGMGEDAPPSIVREIRYPRIDGETPEIQRFNQLMAQRPSTDLEDATSEVVDYQIAYAGPQIVSVRFDMSQDTLGGAHPDTSSKAVTVVMDTGRQLTAADVFRSGVDWQQFITQRAVREITSQFSDYNFVPPEADVRANATKPHLWLVTEQGLVILFPPYSFGGPHALGGTEVTIPWRDLRQYLNPNAPAPIGAQA